MISNHYDWVPGGPPPLIKRHSEVKHSLLRSYLVDYFLTLVSSPAQDRIKLTIVDGFCGGGCYVNGAGERVPGSPLVILNAMREAQAKVMDLQQRRKEIHFDVELVCIDESADAIAYLRGELDAQGYGHALHSGSVKLHCGTFAKLAPQIVQRATERSPRSGRAIFVLDQYGYKAVPQSALALIFRTLPSAEVILTFNVDALINYLSPGTLSAFERRTGFTGAVTAADLDRGTRGPGWRHHIQSSLYSTITGSSGADFFTPFFIRPERGHGDFWLLHLSKHWKARDVMAQAHWQHHNHFGHYGPPGLDMLRTGYAAVINRESSPQATFQFDDVARAASTDAMLAQIPRKLAARPNGIPFGEFFLSHINSTPATMKMVEASVLELVRAKEIQVVDTVGAIRSVRTSLRPNHIIRLPSQKSFAFI
ncbi:three-Cys-motif partner protein TcmP [Paraburkholderia sp.]|uniref:three-Cys-motif partner protein TcmP n=1 Tax=Paraburkholderia sp. TaxID=1926495 RepID=UPI0025E4ADB4|nr:three-Cys-motif partner protein TcmP [Paraburkholderia sp.]